MGNEVSIEEIKNTINASKFERDRLQSLMDDKMEELVEKGQYRTVERRYYELVELISKLNGIGASVYVNDLAIEANELSAVTTQINETVADIQTISKYLTLVGALVDIGVGIVTSSNGAVGIITGLETAKAALGN